jgi:hypothetical protein
MNQAVQLVDQATHALLLQLSAVPKTMRWLLQGFLQRHFAL